MITLREEIKCEEVVEEGLDAFVDADYVNSHAEETFHHRGQNRRARGLPPQDSLDKVAARGSTLKDTPDAANLFCDGYAQE